VRGGRLVKGINFESLRDCGDPVDAAERYAAQGADEIVWLNIAAPEESWDDLLRAVEQAAERVDVPLCVGGGVGRVEQARDLLGRELSHRIKNLFAVVSSLIRLSAQGDESVQPFAQAVRGRIEALGRAHDYVRPYERAPGFEQGEKRLQELLKTVLAPYREGPHGDRILIRGCDPAIGPSGATALALAFHEFATNAVKYGALSNETGRIEVMWTLEDAAEEQQLLLHLIWTEHGGPMVEAPRRRGFGTRLLERGIRFDLGGEVSIEHRPEGLRCEMRVPLDMPTMVFGQAP
jgi:two-component sensor histidine kinase